MATTEGIQLETASYDIQVKTEEAKQHKVPNVISHPEKIDAWRHDRQYDMISPLCRHYADKTWLTVGDSGADAFSYKKRGIDSVVASSLSSSRLQRLQESGPLADVEIKAYNAESIDVPDGSYDIVVCKEAYHHFPRPAIAFYELLRVSRIAVAYNEPNCDDGHYLFGGLRPLIKKLLRGHSFEMQEFEKAGNFIFKLSVTEARKMATALQLPVIAYKHNNDFFVMSLADKNKTNKPAWLVLKTGIFLQSVLSKLRLMPWGRVVLVVFKVRPEQKVLDELKQAGFKIKQIPRNPYI